MEYLEPWQRSHVVRYGLRQVEQSSLKRLVKPLTPLQISQRDFPAVPEILTNPVIQDEVRRRILINGRHKWKALDEIVDLLEEQGDADTARKMRRCHDPTSGHVHFCSHDPKHFFQFRPERCWQRICIKCSKVIAQRMRNRYAKRIKKVTAQRVPQWSLKMLTLTAKREEDLSAQIRTIHKATKKLVKHFWTGKDKRAGAFATFEIGPKGGNVHVHVILYGGFVVKDDISKYWRRLTDNYIVDIGRIDPEKAVGEGIKYITKLSKSEGDEEEWILPNDDLVKLHFALKGKRRVWSWGSFYATEDEDDQDGEGEEAAPGKCPECGAKIASETLAVVYSLLDLKIVIKCSVPEASRAPPG